MVGFNFSRVINLKDLVDEVGQFYASSKQRAEERFLSFPRHIRPDDHKARVNLAFGQKLVEIPPVISNENKFPL